MAAVLIDARSLRTVTPARDPDYIPTRFAQYMRTITTLRRSLSSYCLIRYTGRRGGPQPIIGVVLIQPHRGVGLVRWNLARSGILPRSKHWRTIDDYLHLLRTALDAELLNGGPPSATGLDLERWSLATLQPRWQRILALSPVYTALGDPETLLDQIYEEAVMGKTATAEVDLEYTYTVGDTERPGKASLCATICHLAPHMSLKDVEVFMDLLADLTDEDAFSTSVVLLRRLIDLMMKRAPAEEAGRVERIILASERVVKF